MPCFLKVSFALLASSSQVFQNSNEFTFLQYSKALTIRKVASYRQHAKESQEKRDLHAKQPRKDAKKDARAEQAAHVAAQAAAEQADMLDLCAAFENLDRIAGKESRESKKCQQIIDAGKESQEKRDLHAKQPRKDAKKDARAEQAAHVAAQAAAEQADMLDLCAAFENLDRIAGKESRESKKCQQIIDAGKESQEKRDLHAKRAKKDAKKRQRKFGCFCGRRQK